MVTRTHHEEQSEKDTARVEAFSDGVFAIAITLLVLDLKVPQIAFNDASGPASATLLAALKREWPSYFAFITSFFTILIMWMHHHTVFRLVHRTDASLLLTNGVLLLLVTAVPFPTSVVATYLKTSAAAGACIFYAGLFVLISIAFNLLLISAFRKKVLAPGASERVLRRLRRSYRLGPPLYFVAMAAAAVSPPLSLGICTALWVLWAATAAEWCEVG